MWNVHAETVLWKFFAMKQKLLIYFIRHIVHPVKRHAYYTVRVRLKAVPHTMVTTTTVAQHYQS
jgi:hypothetical protein